MKLQRTLSILSIVSLLAGPVFAHFDVRPRIEDAKIVTDAFEDDTSTTNPNVLVFGYDFGENIDDPFFAQDPGFNAASGSGLTPGVALRFNLLSELSFWDGTGVVSFSPVITGETLDLNFGAQTRTISGASGNQTGFAIQTIGAGGAVHRHLNTFLKGSDGNAVPAGPGPWGSGDGVQAADGIYLFSIELLQDPSGGIAGSSPLFIVFNNGLGEEVHEEAMEWVNANLVPEPVTTTTVGLFVLLLLRRRRSA